MSELVRHLGDSYEVQTPQQAQTERMERSSEIVRAVAEVARAVRAADLTDEEANTLRVYYIPADVGGGLPAVIGWKVGPLRENT